YLALFSVMLGAYFVFAGGSLATFYLLASALGFTCGYWAVFVTIASEQFGTNLRGTATTTAPNFVRGAVVLVTALFQALKPNLGILPSAGAVGVMVVGI